MRGLVPSLIKNSVMTGQYFSILFYMEQILAQANLMSEKKNQAAAAALTKASQSVMSNPIIVVKTRLEVVGFNQYTGVSDAFKQIYVKEGPAAFFTGLKISLIRDVPFSGIFYPMYAFTREQLIGLYEHEMSGKATQAERLKALAIIATISSMAANVAACAITNPLDLIRTRTYFKYHNQDEGQHYRGITHAMAKIYRQDGFLGFFTGLMPRIFRKGFGSIIIWTSYEYLIDKKDVIIPLKE